MLWTETISGEGLPANLYLKLGCLGSGGAALEAQPIQGNSPNVVYLTVSASISTSGSTGSGMPSASGSNSANGYPPVITGCVCTGGGGQTVHLSPSWTLVNTNLSGFRTWSAPMTVVSPTATTQWTGQTASMGQMWTEWEVTPPNWTTFGFSAYFDIAG